MDASVNAPSATTGATAEEEDEAEDAGTTAALARSGATDLMRTADKISLARAPGGTSLARITLRATPVFLRFRHHVLLLGRSPGRCARGVDRSVHLEWP